MSGELAVSDGPMWAMLLHPTTSMFAQKKAETLACDPLVWDKTTQAMADAGMNTAVIDLGDAVVYESHPEIAVRGAWTPTALREHLDRLRELGLTPIPKLNFSTIHHFWLGDYARMVSSPTYYSVCADLIAEVCSLFDTPALFHLGLDEESIYTGDPRFEYVIGRRRNLWWHDALFLIEQVEKAGVRPWVWADEAWSKVREYYDRMPKSVVQSNWFYHNEFPGRATGRPRPLDYRQKETHLAYRDLNDHGFDQIPCGSTFVNDENFSATVEYCLDHIDDDRRLGFLMAHWEMMDQGSLDKHIRAIEVVSRAMQRYGDLHSARNHPPEGDTASRRLSQNGSTSS